MPFNHPVRVASSAVAADGKGHSGDAVSVDARSESANDSGEGGGEGERRLERTYHFPADAALQRLPVLNAVITETMRVHPLVPAKLTREAPAAGAHVVGVWVPGGTTVSVPPYTLQRTASVFPKPDEWDPARWFDSDASAAAAKAFRSGHDSGVDDDAYNDNRRDGKEREQPDPPASADGSDAMRAHMLHFSRGIRTCLGRGIALAELRLALAAMMRYSSNMRLPHDGDADDEGNACRAGDTEADMEMTDHFGLRPRGRRCLLVFE